MAKLSRSELKNIVKECLVEILSEGISASNSSQSRVYESRSPINSQARSKRTMSRPTRRSLDNIIYGSGGSSQESSRKVENSNFNDNVKSTVSSLTSDPTLASIFEDTARTTLQEQLSVDRGPVSHEAATFAQGDAAAKAASVSDPMDLFAGAADKWSSLAFSDPIRK
jgi:hypothetical protein